MDRRVLEQAVAEGVHLRLHDLERQTIIATHEADQLAGVLLGHQVFRHRGKQVEVAGDGQQQGEQGQPRMRQRPLQAASIEGQYTLLHPRAELLQTAGRAFLFFGLEPARAEHRRQGQRHGQGDQDRRRQGHGELAEQAADDAAHEQDGHEHRDQRQVHRQQGETNLLRPLERRRHGLFAGLDMPRDVLQHDDGVVHHQAGADDQRHQRQVVQREVQQVHHREGADQRHRYRQSRNQRGAPAAEEQEDHHDHQGHGDQQGTLGFVQAGADHRRAVHGHIQLGAGRHHRLQGRQFGADVLDGLDDVGARLAVDHQQHGLLVVVEA